MFVASRSIGASVMLYTIDFSKFVKVIGAVAFIRLLLVMYGVEPNPGPTDKLVFRYQYLLIEVGTKVLKNVFDKIVGNDFMRYLNANPAQYKQLSYLTNRIINDTQKQLLPPIDMKPDSFKFDITLLALLLRNVCGLCSQGDSVWKTPAPGDLSVEADITRIRDSRNNLQHIGTVYVSEADFTDKWDKLCEILKRLASNCGMTNLSPLIDEAKTKDIDEELRIYLDNTVKAWKESEYLHERDIEGLKLNLSKLEDGQTKMEDRQNKLEDEQSVMKQDLSKLKEDQSTVEGGWKKVIKETLKKFYQEECHTLGVSPLCGEDDDMELVTIYQPPDMCHVPYHRNREQEKNYQISSFKEIFSRRNTIFKNVFVTGDAGVGKTSLCQCMSYLWYMALYRKKVENKFLEEGIGSMAQFDFVFYISLRDTVHEDITSMIIDQFFYTKSCVKREKMIQQIENVLQQNNCLVILDGLDEWSPNKSGDRNRVLPRKIPSDKCTYLTTCRPYKIENARLSHNAIDHQVQMKGITRESAERYVKNIVNHFNQVNQANNELTNFVREVDVCGLSDQLCIPIIASQLVLVWFRQSLTSMSRALIYSNVVEMLFERADLKKAIALPSTTECKLKLPESFEELTYLQTYAPLLQKMCLLSFRSLFKLDDHVSVLVFPRKKMMSKPYFFTSEELEFFCKLGILSKNKVIGCQGEMEHKLSFLHKTYLEFLSALFVTSFDTNGLFDHLIKEWKFVDDVVQYQEFIVLLAGFSERKVLFLLDKCTIYHTFYSRLPTSSCPSVKIRLILDIAKTVSCYNNFELQFHFVYAESGRYLNAYDQAEGIKYLFVGHPFCIGYDIKFNACMLNNESSLQILCIEGDLFNKQLVPELPVRSLRHLTSLSLSHVTLQHNCLRNLEIFLSENVLMENIKVYKVNCDNHKRDVCSITLNLANNTQLATICLFKVDILCQSVNNSSLLRISLSPVSERIVRGYIDLFNSIRYSKISHLYFEGNCISHDDTMRTLTSVVKTLPCIESLSLYFMNLPDDVVLQLHSNVTHARIELECVKMSRKCFYGFIKSMVNQTSEIKVTLHSCSITSVDGETDRKLQLYYSEAVDYMSEYLKSLTLSKVNITQERDGMLQFTTTSGL